LRKKRSSHRDRTRGGPKAVKVKRVEGKRGETTKGTETVRKKQTVLQKGKCGRRGSHTRCDQKKKSKAKIRSKRHVKEAAGTVEVKVGSRWKK